MLHLSFSSFLLSNLFFLSIFAFLAFFFFLIFFLLGVKKSTWLFSVLLALVFSISTASAGTGTDVIIAASANTKIVPFSQLIEYSLSQNFQEYNALAKAYNVGAFLGTNAGSFNLQHPELNSYSLLHQCLQASQTNSTEVVVSINAFIKPEVTYLSRNPLTEAEVNF